MQISVNSVTDGGVALKGFRNVHKRLPFLRRVSRDHIFLDDTIPPYATIDLWATIPLENARYNFSETVIRLSHEIAEQTYGGLGNIVIWNRTDLARSIPRGTHTLIKDSSVYDNEVRIMYYGQSHLINEKCVDGPCQIIGGSIMAILPEYKRYMRRALFLC
jgi:hypothetical protein